MRTLLRATLLVVLLGCGLTFTTGPASALSCIDPSSVAGTADHVFTGSITDAGKGRIEVSVKEIWKGGPLAEHVTLRTELDGWWDGMKNGHLPDGYRSTSTWLFMSRADADGRQVVGPCSAWPRTKPWGEDVRPLSAMPPLSDDRVLDTAGPLKATSSAATKDTKAVSATDDDGPNLLVRGGAAGLALGAVGALVLLVRYRRG